MNWFVFSDSPKWTWLHALKPTYNAESSGFGLGFWRPYDDAHTTDLEKGHFRYNPQNWHSLAGFVRYMPWNAIRMEVAEHVVFGTQRVLAFKTPKTGVGGPRHSATPEDRLGLVLTNSEVSEVTVTVAFANTTGLAQPFYGHRYTVEEEDVALGTLTATSGELNITLPPGVSSSGPSTDCPLTKLLFRSHALRTISSVCDQVALRFQCRCDVLQGLWSFSTCASFACQFCIHIKGE